MSNEAITDHRLIIGGDLQCRYGSVGTLSITLSIYAYKNTYNIDIFLVRPGDGEEFVYSPVDVNATLYCAVNTTNLFWIVDDLNFDVSFDRNRLHSRGIFRSPATSEGTMESVVKVFGNTETNNNIQICCKSFLGSQRQQTCTTLIIYGMMIA